MPVATSLKVKVNNQTAYITLLNMQNTIQNQINNHCTDCPVALQGD